MFGRYVYAIGGNREAAEYSGIPVRRVETLTYVISAGLGGRGRGLLRGLHRADVAAGGHRLRALRDRGGGARRVSLRGGEGTVLGIDHRLVHHAGHRQRHQHVPVALPGRARACRGILRLDTNWTFIIIGAVILVAVVLDQVVHMVQAKRQLRKTMSS